MTIRPIVLVPSLLILASATYFAFRPAAPTPSAATMSGTRSPAAAPLTAPRAANAAPTSSLAATTDAGASAMAARAVAGPTRSTSDLPAAPVPAHAAAVDVARVLADAGPVPAQTSMGPVPAEGSGLYGAPDRLSARRISASRAEGRDDAAKPGDAVRSGDAVRIRYRMYELMSGREVEASPPEGILVRVGTGFDDSAAAAVNRVPRGVAESLGYAHIGDVIEVILPKETKDLPPELDSSQAHKLHLTVVARY